MNSQAALILDSRREEIRGPFIAGDTRAFLKAVADPLVEPLIEDAVADIRRNLQRNDRFDVLQWVADESGDLTGEDIQDQADIPAKCGQRRQRLWQNHRAADGGAGLPAYGAGAPAQAGGDAAVAGNHATDGQQRMPGCGVRAEFGHPKADQGGDYKRRVLFSRCARFGD